MEEESVMSKRDVIVRRGIWYAMTLLSLFGLSVSLNLLWPPGAKSSSSRFLRDGAVSVTTFYAVTLVRYLFFTDPPSPHCYKDFTTVKEKIPQLLFAEISMLALVLWPWLYYSYLVGDDKVVSSLVLYMSLFATSLFTGGIGLIQLSDKFRMEMRHAYFTLFSFWMCCLVDIFMPMAAMADSLVLVFTVLSIYYIVALFILAYNLGMHKDPVSPLPT